jgi:hypothetical protein
MSTPNGNAPFGCYFLELKMDVGSHQTLQLSREVVFVPHAFFVFCLEAWFSQCERDMKTGTMDRLSSCGVMFFPPPPGGGVP